MRSLLPFLLLAAACGGSSSPAAPPDTAPVDAGQDTGTAPPPPPGPVAITFLDADGHETTRQIVYEPAEIHVRGAPAGAHVTLRASMGGDQYASSVVFVAGADGTISTKTQAPESGGSYSGVDVDGPFWSMAARDPASTLIASADVVVHAQIDGQDVGQATLARPFAADGVKQRSVSDNGLVGVYYTPATPGPHPAVLTFGGSEGGLRTGSIAASFLASLGYASLGVAYFGAPGLPDYLERIPLEYLGTALKWLEAQPEVAPTKIAVMGASRGGELALLLGATFPDVHAVVAQVPSGLVWGDTHTGTGAAWTFQGKDIPGMTHLGDVQTTTDAQGKTVYVETPAFDGAIAMSSSAELDAATTRVEKTQGPILMLAGGDDQLWPSCRLSQIAMDRLTANGHAAKYADALQCYPHAGHFLGPDWAALPTTMPQEAELQGVLFALGGDGPGLGHGDRDAYTKLKAFLAKAFP
jgi:acetyl esterase/lipase